MISRRRRGLDPWEVGRPRIPNGKAVQIILPAYYLTALEGLTNADKVRNACKLVYEMRTGERVEPTEEGRAQFQKCG